MYKANAVSDATKPSYNELDSADIDSAGTSVRTDNARTGIDTIDNDRPGGGRRQSRHYSKKETNRRRQ